MQSNAKSLHLRSLLISGREAMRLQNWQLASEFWKQVISEDSECFEGWYRLAQVSYKLERLRDCVSYSETARAIQPTHLGNLTSLARAYQRVGALEQSVVTFKDIVGLSPDNYEAYYRIGQCLKILNQPVSADQYFAIAQKIKPEDIHVQLYRVELLTELGKFDCAMKSWQVFSARMPNDIGVQKKYSAFLLKHKRQNQAESVLVNLLRVAPSDFEAASMLAKIFFEAKRWKDVVELLEPIFKAVHVDGASLNFQLRLQFARALDIMGRRQDAEFHYREVLKTQPNNTISLIELGRLLRDLDRQQEAIEFYRMACKTEPHDLGRWQELILLYVSLGCRREVSETVRLAESAVPKSPINFVHLGRICQQAHLLDDAWHFYKRAVDADTSMAKHMGLFCEQQGLFVDAIRYLTIARDIDPSSIELANSLISQLEICKVLGVNHEWVISNDSTPNLLLPELLYEDLVERLVFCNHFYDAVPGRVILIGSSLAPGGAERQLAITASRLARDRPDIESVTLVLDSISTKDQRDFYLSYFLNSSVEVITLDALRKTSSLCGIGHSNLRFIRAFPKAQRESILIYYQEFVARRPEVVHSWQDSTCLNTVIAAALAGVPKIILSTRSTRPNSPRRPLERYMRRAYIAVMRLPNILILNNSQAGARDYENWLELQPGTVKVIYNGLDDGLLLNANNQSKIKSSYSQYKIPENALVIGGIFRLTEEKRPFLWIETAAEIAKKIPNSHFIVAGDGPARIEMLSYAINLGIEDRVHLIGRVNIAPWLQVMDILLLTSHTEGLPNVLIEAQLFGIPVVTPDVGGCIEAIEQGVTGWIVSTATAASFSERIVEILTNSAWREQAKTAASKYVRRKFSADMMIHNTIEAYGFHDRHSFPESKTRCIVNNDGLCAKGQDAHKNSGDNFQQLLLKVVETTPEDINTNFELGKIFFMQLSYECSAEYFKAVVSKSRNHTDGWRWLARSQAALMDLGDALASWRKLLALVPDDFEGLHRMGEILESSGEASLAENVLLKAYLLKPSHPEVNQLLARTNKKNSKYFVSLKYWLRFCFFKVQFFICKIMTYPKIFRPSQIR